ncbi:MAG: hypothetical protein S4CHLAM20_11670 [Chlamydiia bacterium]|nr:hypothetical protein [Chlamydiia bacterium]
MASANYSGLANLMNLQGVGVNPTSQLAYVPSKDLMTRYQTIPNPRTGIPQAMGVTGMADGGMPSEQYPMQEEAMELANRGRYGDTTLVHMTPGEVQGLSSLGQLTINPDTGLPEAFNMKSLIPAIAGIAASIVLPVAAAPIFGASGALGSFGTAAASGLGTFGGGLLSGKSTGEAALGGLMSFGIGSILGGGTPGLAENTGGAAYGTAAQSPEALALSEVDDFFELGGLPTDYSAASGFNDAAYYTSRGAVPTVSGAPTVGQAVPDVIAPVSYSAAGVPKLTSAAVERTSSLGQALMQPSGYSYSLEKAYEPSALGKLIGREAIPGGNITKDQFMQLGGIPSDITLGESAKQVLSKPSTYAPLGIAALTGGFDDPYEYKKPEDRPVPDTGFGRYTLAGGEVKRPVATEEELRRRAVEGGSQNYFTPYNYVRNAAEGGIVGLQQGGMATPQAPSAMAGMLAQPQPQQPLPINVQVQPQQSVMPQQPQPSMPMSQTGSGVAPLPDQQKEFIKLMDMEEQLQSQKSSQSTQSLASIMGLGMNFASNQYPQTSPSGQAVQPPPTPPMNYGSQVNMGLAAGGQPYFEGQVQGPGDGQSDEVAFRVDGGQVDGAMLSPQEYVLAADVVSAIGNGSSDAGAEKLDQFMKGVRQDAYGTTKQMQPFNNQGLTNLVA